ncbi:MAG: hypothetical protein HKN47_28070 [Pirellulaceae bacterium]|nr:hypothetical protein [Pirellulaceae bacterium]
MAVHEHDHEDLLRDGRKMPLRGRTQIGDTAVVVGFRQQGQLSLYCGVDPVFQFDLQQKLRRVYFSGERFMAQSGELVQLIRTHRGGRVTFAKRPFGPQQASEILNSSSRWIDQLRGIVKSASNGWEVVGPADCDFIGSLAAWLDSFPPGLPQIANDASIR